jgi:hypothetical protein
MSQGSPSGRKKLWRTVTTSTRVVHEQVAHLGGKEADVILVGPGLVVADMQHDQVVLDLDEDVTHMLGIVPGQEQFRLSESSASTGYSKRSSILGKDPRILPVIEGEQRLHSALCTLDV